MGDQKEHLRASLKARRQVMSKERLIKVSQKVYENLVSNIDWQNITSLHTYIPIPSLNEVDSWAVLTYVWNNFPTTTTAISSARQSGKYMALKVNPATKWRGIYPTERWPMPADFKYDVIIVPTLAFDVRGFRLGWGGGFYDRFLTAQPQAKKIGLCFSDFEVERVPNEPHDIKLDAIVTEKAIIGRI